MDSQFRGRTQHKAGSVSSISRGSRERSLLGITAVVAVLALIALAIALWKKPPAGTRLVASIPPPEEAPFQLIGDVGTPPVLSPDGLSLVFGAGDHIWIRSLESGEAHPLEGTENGTFPFWSPDSRRIAFFSAGKLRVMDIVGGAPVPYCDVPTPLSSMICGFADASSWMVRWPSRTPAIVGLKTTSKVQLFPTPSFIGQLLVCL